MKTQTLYKVVAYSPIFSAIFGENTFASFDSCWNRFSIKYRLNEISSPRIGKIFCFDSLENAKDFALSHSNSILLEGIGAYPSKIKKICKQKFDFEKFWTQKTKKQKITVETTIPLKGTVLVDSFTPTKMVKYEIV